MKHHKVSPKVVDIYPIPGQRNPVALIEKYVSLLPKDGKTTSFYLHSRKDFHSSDEWYLSTPVGVNKLQSMVSDMCKQAGIPGYYTYHSLRATAATRMYHAKCDEQLIQEVTGHRLLAVRAYKRTCNEQKQIATQCILGKNRDITKRKQSCSKHKRMCFSQ